MNPALVIWLPVSSCSVRLEIKTAGLLVFCHVIDWLMWFTTELPLKQPVSHSINFISLPVGHLIKQQAHSVKGFKLLRQKLSFYFEKALYIIVVLSVKLIMSVLLFKGLLVATIFCFFNGEVRCIICIVVCIYAYLHFGHIMSCKVEERDI